MPRSKTPARRVSRAKVAIVVRAGPVAMVTAAVARVAMAVVVAKAVVIAAHAVMATVAVARVAMAAASAHPVQSVRAAMTTAPRPSSRRPS